MSRGLKEHKVIKQNKELYAVLRQAPVRPPLPKEPPQPCFWEHRNQMFLF